MKTLNFKSFILIAILLTLGAGQMWGADASSANVYYDNTSSAWSDVQLFIGHSSYSIADGMTKLTNSNNLYYKRSYSWGGYSAFYFTTGASGWEGREENVDTRVTYTTHYSAKKTDNLGSSTWLFISSGSSNGSAVSGSTITGYDKLNYTQTVQQQLSTDGGSSYSASTSSLATVKVASYYLSSATATSATATSGTISAGNSSANCKAVRTATVTYTVTSVASGYSFVGWYDGSTQKSTSTTYTYNATEAKTITARFKAEETHDVTVEYKYGSVTVKTATTESAVGVTTERTFTAPEIDGYNFYSYTFADGLTRKTAENNTNPCRFVTKSTGTYKLTVNYDIAPVKLQYGSSTPLNSPTETAMTYDAVNKRFYVDVTTNSTPYYFRFKYNNGVQEYGGAWNTYPDVLAVTANGSKVACAEKVIEWENKSSVKFTGANGSDIRIYFDYFNKQTWITETTYSVTVAAGTGGSASPASVTAGKNTSSGTITATPNTGYYFNNWTKSSNSITIASASSASTTVKATATGTVTANFLAQWYLPGSKTELGSWNETANPFTGYITEGGKNKGYFAVTLLPNTTYEVKVKDRTGSWYGLASAASPATVYYSTASTEWTMTSASGNKNLTVSTAAGGEYTFEWNLTDKKLKVNYPTSWYITMGKSGSGSVSAVDNESNTITNGQFVKDNATVTWTATPSTGYDLEGWYSNSGCTTKYVHNGTTIVINDAAKTIALSSIDANKTVYAKFTPKKTTITYSQSGTGYGSGGPSTTKTATYGSAMPSISGSVPVAANGYAFMGYYDALEPLGTQYYTETGASARNWDKTSNTTLYAYFKKAEITDLSIEPSLAEKGGTVEVTPEIEPTPAGTTSICYYLLYANGNKVDPQPDFGNPNTFEKVSFTAPSVAGTYTIAAALRTGSTCGGGTLLDSVATHTFQVGGEYNVTVKYMRDNVAIKPQTKVAASPSSWTEITAPDIIGYSFSKWKAGDGVTIQGAATGESTSQTINFQATYDGTLTALYTKRNIIYFNNTYTQWSDVYVYFYNNGKYWAEGYGTGAYKGKYFDGDRPYWETEHGHMTRIEGTNIWYFDYTDAGYSTRSVVAFANMDKSNSGTDNTSDNTKAYFANTTSTPIQVARRSDHNASLPMFVPITQTGVKLNGNKANYTSEGYWMNYPENTGYSIRLFNQITGDGTYEVDSIPVEFTEDYTLAEPINVLMDAGHTYGFKLFRADNVWMGNTGTMTNGASGDVGQTAWEFRQKNDDSSDKPNCGLTTTAAGTYTFSVSYGKKGSSYDYLVGVHYPVVANDFQILYIDNAKWSGSTAHDPSTWAHPSRTITARANGVDTISFFVSKGADISASLKARKVKSIAAGTGVITWEDLNIAGAASKSLTVDSAAVWNFKVTQGATAGTIASIENIGAYTGDYYIRCNALNNKWGNFRDDNDHLMTYTAFSESSANAFGDKFSHYKAKWCPRGTNVKFCIANDYSLCISDTLIKDVTRSWPDNMDANGTLSSDGSADVTADKWSANIRFMWNRKTNKISRAYVASATNTTRKFLVLRGCDAKIHDHNNNAIPATTYLGANEVLLDDDQNWIYETTIKAQPTARVKLYACYGENPASEPNAQYFRGAYDSNQCDDDANSIQILGGSGSNYYLMRVIYDFKTNRLITAWLPDGTAVDQAPLDIDADVMVIRDHQQGAEAITFTNSDKSLGNVKTVYGTMRFNRWTLSNRYRSSDTGNPSVVPSTTETDIEKDHCNTTTAISRYHAPLPTHLQTSSFERNNYFISFPFDVELSEVFGFGTYGTHWIISKYNGLRRAQVGYFRDNCINGDFDCTNWDYIWDRTGVTLNAYEGYLLSLDLDLMQYDDTTNFWLNQIHQVELYFPSKVPMSTITTTNVTLPSLGDEYLCKKNYDTPPGSNPEGDRRVKDSYWRCIGVPSYAPYGTVLKTGETEIQWNNDYTWYEDERSFPFLYEWNTTDNTLTPQRTKTFAFKPLHSYLVQNKNSITWTAVSATPSSIVARRRQLAEELHEYSWRLALNGDENDESDTYIRMTDDEDVTEGFDFGPDMIKKFRDGYIVDANGDPIWDSSIDDYKQGVLHSDIYSVLGYEYLAANSLPLNTETTTIVPVGVRLKKAGEYTISMPDGTYGVSITLVDNVTGTRTELGAGFTYTFEAEAGQVDDRFYLEIAKIKDIATGTEEIGEPSKSDVRKVMIDGILYIVRDNVLYDARGARVK